MPATSEQALKAYCSGAASALGQTLGILDLEKIIAARELQVMEKVQ
jgi:chemotaxis signal transduction protein